MTGRLRKHWPWRLFKPCTALAVLLGRMEEEPALELEIGVHGHEEEHLVFSWGMRKKCNSTSWTVFLFYSQALLRTPQRVNEACQRLQLSTDAFSGRPKSWTALMRGSARWPRRMCSSLPLHVLLPSQEAMDFLRVPNLQGSGSVMRDVAVALRDMERHQALVDIWV